MQWGQVIQNQNQQNTLVLSCKWVLAGWQPVRQAFLREWEQNLGSSSCAREKSERKGYSPFTLLMSLESQGYILVQSGKCNLLSRQLHVWTRQFKITRPSLIECKITFGISGSHYIANRAICSQQIKFGIHVRMITVIDS